MSEDTTNQEAEDTDKIDLINNRLRTLKNQTTVLFIPEPIFLIFYLAVAGWLLGSGLKLLTDIIGENSLTTVIKFMLGMIMSLALEMHGKQLFANLKIEQDYRNFFKQTNSKFKSIVTSIEGNYSPQKSQLLIFVFLVVMEAIFVFLLAYNQDGDSSELTSWWEAALIALFPIGFSVGFSSTQANQYLIPKIKQKQVTAYTAILVEEENKANQENQAQKQQEELKQNLLKELTSFQQELTAIQHKKLAYEKELKLLKLEYEDYV